MAGVSRFPFPKLGEVPNYVYLFKADAAKGASEGNKARPVLVIAAGEGRVVVIAVTTKGEFSTSATVKIPEDVAKAMGFPGWLRVGQRPAFGQGAIAESSVQLVFHRLGGRESQLL